MKNIFRQMNNMLITPILLLIVCSNAQSQCVPLSPTGVAGISPHWTHLPCAERGVPYNEAIYFENFTTVSAAGFTATVINLTINSINNLPSGISYTAFPSNSFSQGATGCINLTGLTNASAGDYLFEIIMTLTLDIPVIGIQTFGPMEGNALVAQLESLAGGPSGIDFTYYLKVIHPGSICSNTPTATCTSTPPTGNAGFTPPPQSFPCAEQGIYFDEIIGYENFTTLLPGIGVNSLRFDSITNLPCHLNWTTNKPGNTFGPGETGCIQITGTTNDAAGQFKLGIWITIDIQGLGAISGETGDLSNAFGVFGTNPNGYWVRVKQSGFACTFLDTSSAALNLTAFCSGSSVDIQSIHLNQGWNMISSYINPDNPVMLDVINPISGDVLLVKDGAGNVTIPSLGVNNVGNWDVTKGYKIRAASNITLTLYGIQVNPAQTPLNLPSGWSIIAYLRHSTMNASNAFSAINSSMLLAKDGLGNTYIPNLGINSIGDLQPGQGYKLRMSSGDILIYPGN